MTERVAIPPPRQWLIFSTLDQALLDGQSVAPDSVYDLLAVLGRHGVPVIFNSARTPGELARIADQLGLQAPRIAEAGSVIAYPQWMRNHYLGVDYDQICERLHDLRQRYQYRFQGFSDWTAEEIAVRAGLKLEVARLVRQRKASEPLMWEDTPERLEQFRQHLQQAGLELRPCEHFWRVSGPTDALRAMQYVIADYSEQWGYQPFVILLMDQVDDCTLLPAAQLAVFIGNDLINTLSLHPMASSALLLSTQKNGVQGWIEAVAHLLTLAGQPRTLARL